MFRALPSREDLARIDPFTLGEAVALQLHSLDDDELRAFAHTCATRFDGYHRSEIKRALAENPSDGAVLRDAMIAFFRGNPRAIERCEAPFVAATLRGIETPPENSLELEGEEPSRHKPLMLAVAIGLVLLGAGAALDRLAFAMHSPNAATPEPVLIYVTPAPVHTLRPAAKKPRVHATQQVPKPRIVAVAPVAVAAPVITAPIVHRRTYWHRRVAHAPKQIAASPKRVAAAPKHRAVKPFHAKPKNVAVVPKPKPSPKPAQRARIRYGPLIRVAVAPSATPAPRRRSWLQRQLDHLNPFKHHPDVQYKKH
jgi:hypothetical protein